MRSSLFDRLLAGERRCDRRRFARASAWAFVLGTAAVGLLGVSGWFIAAAAVAGAAGLATAQAFNYLLPSAAIRLLAIARTGARYGERLLAHEAALFTLAQVRPALFRAIARAAPARATSIAVGEAATALVQDLQAIEAQLVRRSVPWSTAAAIVSGLAMTALASRTAALSTVACLLALLVGTRRTGHRLRRHVVDLRTSTGALKDELFLLSTSQSELRCYGLEPWALDRIKRRVHDVAAAEWAHANAASRFELLPAASTAVAVTLAAWLSQAAGAAMAAMAALAAAVAVETAAQLARSHLARIGADEAAARIDALLGGAEPDLADLDTAPLELQDLRLTWPCAARLPAGAQVAIVGPSGSGKTRLVEQLIGLRAAAAGHTLLGGRDITGLSPQTLRKTFAWLPQDAALLAGTVRENLGLANGDGNEPAMWRALHDAAIDERVRAWPNGLDTWIGAEDCSLSAGERRRLALARAYLSAAPWLLLDEPTEGLDAELERRVLDRLAGRLRHTRQGLIAVTHRAAVVKTCDVVLEAGTDTSPDRLSSRVQPTAALTEPA